MELLKISTFYFYGPEDVFLFFKSTLPLSLATRCDGSSAYLFGFQFPLNFLLLEKSSAFL